MSNLINLIAAFLEKKWPLLRANFDVFIVVTFLTTAVAGTAVWQLSKWLYEANVEALKREMEVLEREKGFEKRKADAAEANLKEVLAKQQQHDPGGILSTKGVAADRPYTPIQDVTLGDAMTFVAQTRKHWKTVRILADTSSQIERAFEINKLEGDSIRVILRGITSEERQRDTKMQELDNEINFIITRWCGLMDDGIIKTLNIQRGVSFPLEYSLIFDDEILISGLYLPYRQFGQSGVQDPILIVGPTGFARPLIEKYKTRFDSFSTYVEKGQASAGRANCQ